MLREIRLYGRLAKFVGRRVLRADVASAAEAVRYLVTNWPELERHMADQHYRVSVGGHAIDRDELHNPAGRDAIRIAPVTAGAGAIGRIILGALLIAASFFIIPLGIAAAGAGIATAVGLTGAALVLGGISELLTPVPKTGQEEQDPRKSYSFSGIQNTSRQGTPVPVVYGETVVGSVVISAGIDIEQVAV